MARIRTIKPSFFTSLTIANLTLAERLTFIGLWTHVDDEGRCVYDPRLLKAAIWPLDDVTPEDVGRITGALQEASLLTVYTVDGRLYLNIGTLLEHQKISHPTKSVLPPPETGEIVPLTSTLEASGSVPGGFTETSGWERKGREGKGSPASPPGANAPDVPRKDVDQVCDLLADRIQSNGSNRPAVTAAWRKEARLLIDRDGRTIDQIVKAIEWSQADSFWKINILSMPKLREKFDQLRLAAQKENVAPTKGPRYVGHPDQMRMEQ